MKLFLLSSLPKIKHFKKITTYLTFYGVEGAGRFKIVKSSQVKVKYLFSINLRQRIMTEENMTSTNIELSLQILEI